MKIITLFFLVILLWECKPKSTTMSSKVVTDTIAFNSIIGKWEKIPITSLFEKPSKPKEYTRKELDTLKEGLQNNILFRYDRRERIQKNVTFYTQINNYLQKYISNQFYNKIPISNSTSPEEIEFAQDTFKMNETLRIIKDCDPTGTYKPILYSFRMYQNSAQEYIIYKYYMKLLKRMEKEEQEKLVKSQENWNKTLRADLSLTSKFYQYVENNIWNDYHLNIAYKNRITFLFRLYCNYNNIHSFYPY